MSVRIDPPYRQAAIGVFDSGVGGLSVVKHLRQLLPQESFLYVADTRFAPYGERSEAEITQRALAITEFFLARSIKALVVACNTATAAAVAALRAAYPELIIVGIEPGLKPAAHQSLSKRVGVLATQRTLQSDKFNRLREQLATENQVSFYSQACVGLVNQIETGDWHAPALHSLIQHYLWPLLDQGVDTLVLGCTHYPLVKSQIHLAIEAYRQSHPLSAAPIVIDTGEAVARRLHQLLSDRNLLNAAVNSIEDERLQAWSTGDTGTLQTTLDWILPAHQIAAMHVDI